jgi:hypothetical protein
MLKRGFAILVQVGTRKGEPLYQRAKGFDPRPGCQLEDDMTKEQAIKRLDGFAEDDDTERAHYNADKILTEFLSSLGHQDVVDAYDNVGKWYA